MEDYSHAAEQMKDAIIEEYLKDNPGVQRNELMTRMVNGKMVIEQMKNIFVNGFDPGIIRWTQKRNVVA